MKNLTSWSPIEIKWLQKTKAWDRQWKREKDYLSRLKKIIRK
uniref:Intraflagellar transport 74 n=1 Tax=Molossus molossus TaxID=27622 RepID=A0A7J8EE08_MOLMO|nr:intraflagellar transport 74 [Molossus molossus]